MAVTTSFGFYDLFPELGPVTIVDVGAALTSKPPFYQTLADAGHAAVVGFEPDPAAFEELNRRTRPPQRNYPYFIGDGTEGTFHQARLAAASSLLPPNPNVIDRFTDLPRALRLLGTMPVTTRRLDDVLPDAEIDMLKIDVQGSELSVMQGAPRLLPTALVVETEVEFVQLYAQQPLFADIDIYLRQRGFQFHMLKNAGQFYYTPIRDPKQPLIGVNQLVYADAVYVPDLARACALPRERLLKLAALLHDFYKSWDLVLHLLQALSQRGEPEPFQRYLARLELS